MSYYSYPTLGDDFGYQQSGSNAIHTCQPDMYYYQSENTEAQDFYQPMPAYYPYMTYSGAPSNNEHFPSSSFYSGSFSDRSTPSECSENGFVERPQVILKNSTTWKRFAEVGNEMKVLVTGRNLFPTLQVEIFGLKPESLYSIGIHLQPVDAYKLKFHKISQQWQRAVKTHPTLFESTNQIRTEPMSGKELASKLNLDRIKLFNQKNPKKQAAAPSVENEMRRNNKHCKEMLEVQLGFKYIPVINVFEIIDGSLVNICIASFEETEFVTVSGYCNERIKVMKKENGHTRNTYNAV
uniref:T-box domain-containing protein n=1 Tax=Caenorhabditis japonica TaxID=281687 RepID=A0A8R1DX42_CAEJA